MALPSLLMFQLPGRCQSSGMRRLFSAKTVASPMLRLRERSAGLGPRLPPHRLPPASWSFRPMEASRKEGRKVGQGSGDGDLGFVATPVRRGPFYSVGKVEVAAMAPLTLALRRRAVTHRRRRRASLCVVNRRSAYVGLRSLITLIRDGWAAN
jgi:hypothetical protein